MKTAADRIALFNQNRIPDLAKIKFRNMASDPFRFYRGTCHLFYEDLSHLTDNLPKSPATWASGDLHLENFGSYKADNRLPYFDINDFDEGCLMPALWEISRLLTSILVASDFMQISKSDAETLCNEFVRHYSYTLTEAHAGFVEEETSEGIVKDLLDNRKSRKRKAFLKDRTTSDKGKIKLLVDDKHVSKVPKEKKEELENIVEKWAAAEYNNPGFYKVLDVGYRIAGTGSLGLERYVLLIEGLGSPDDNYLLDLKVANQSAINPYLKTLQPGWKNEAERIIQIQKRMQAVPLALLNTIQIKSQWFVMRELQPTQDKVDLADCKGKMHKLETFISTIAQITAWAQLRSGGRQGSAIADELINFGEDKSWQKSLMNYVKEYSNQVKKDFKEYCKAYDSGTFGH
jgi:uncharacterized protein (DUF2252 family)